MELNHATLTRADMLAMTPIGAPLYAVVPSAPAEPAAPARIPEQRPAEAPVGTTYTYGVPSA
jgi:hypothetical protein